MGRAEGDERMREEGGRGRESDGRDMIAYTLQTY